MLKSLLFYRKDGEDRTRDLTSLPVISHPVCDAIVRKYWYVVRPQMLRNKLYGEFLPVNSRLVFTRYPQYRNRSCQEGLPRHFRYGSQDVSFRVLFHSLFDEETSATQFQPRRENVKNRFI